MTKQFLQTTLTLLCGAALASSPAWAGSTKSIKEEVVVEEPTQWWNAELSTGWDSLYMFRGINVLRNDKSYGTSIYWTSLNTTFNLTENDSLTLGSWMGFGLSDTDYKEFDAIVSYTHTLGNLSLSAGYTFYYVIESSLSSHELNVGAAYEFDLGFMSLTPGIFYFFNLGPDLDHKGIADSAASFLQLRLDGSASLYKDGVVAVEPWIAFGTNFRYNFNGAGDLFNGLNNLEIGLSLPIQLSSVVSISPYVAFSEAINGDTALAGTRRSTFWSGGSVTFSF